MILVLRILGGIIPSGGPTSINSRYSGRVGLIGFSIFESAAGSHMVWKRGICCDGVFGSAGDSREKRPFLTASSFDESDNRGFPNFLVRSCPQLLSETVQGTLADSFRQDSATLR